MKGFVRITVLLALTLTSLGLGQATAQEQWDLATAVAQLKFGVCWVYCSFG